MTIRDSRDVVDKRERWLRVGAGTQQIVFAKLLIDRKTLIYVFDLQRRVTGEDENKTNRDKYAIFGCRSVDGSALSEGQLRAIAEEVLEKTGWPRENDRLLSEERRRALVGLRFAKTRHMRNDEGGALKERILRKIVEVLFLEK